jgi:DNA-binding MarR family transcriptional regulator
MTWKPLIYRGVDYGEFYEVSNMGHIKRKERIQVGLYHEVVVDEKIHKPKERFNIKIKSLKLRKDIDVKRAVAENFLEAIEEYHYVHKYDDTLDNRSNNLYWSNEKKKERLPATYNIFRKDEEEEKNKQIVEAYMEGLTYKEIITKFNITRHYVRKVLDSRGIKREQVRNRTNTDVDLDVFKKYFLEKRSLSYVAEKTGFSKHIVAYYKEKMGFTKILEYKKYEKGELQI